MDLAVPSPHSAYFKKRKTIKAYLDTDCVGDHEVENLLFDG